MMWDSSTSTSGSAGRVGGRTVTVSTLEVTARGLLREGTRAVTGRGTAGDTAGGATHLGGGRMSPSVRYSTAPMTKCDDSSASAGRGAGDTREGTRGAARCAPRCAPRCALAPWSPGHARGCRSRVCVCEWEPGVSPHLHQMCAAVRAGVQRLQMCAHTARHSQMCSYPPTHTHALPDVQNLTHAFTHVPSSRCAGSPARSHPAVH